MLRKEREGGHHTKEQKVELGFQKFGEIFTSKKGSSRLLTVDTANGLNQSKRLKNADGQSQLHFWSYLVNPFDPEWTLSFTNHCYSIESKRSFLINVTRRVRSHKFYNSRSFSLDYQWLSFDSASYGCIGPANRKFQKKIGANKWERIVLNSYGFLQQNKCRQRTHDRRHSRGENILRLVYRLRYGSVRTLAKLLWVG